MPVKKKKTATKVPKKPIVSYKHLDKQRLNNPPVGIVTPETDPDEGNKKKYEYDPHLDPQLVWAGKAEHTSFEVPTVSLHVHERIDPRTILDSVKKKNGDHQPSLFDAPGENLPVREIIEFYKHKLGWTNRLIAGDSLLVMNSLIEKEGMAGEVQMVYFDPPYGINYSSNFQAFTNKKVVKERDEDLSSEPEMIKAFRDTWQLGIHSYLTYIQDRAKLAYQLLDEKGSLFIQISDENFHFIRNILDEIFGVNNFVCDLRFRTRTIPLSSKLIDVSYDHVIWYAKDIEKLKFNKLFFHQNAEGDQNYRFVELSDKTRRPLKKDEHNNHELLPKDSKVFAAIRLRPTQYRKNQDFNFDFENKKYAPPGGKIENTPDGKNCWSTTPTGLSFLKEKNRLIDIDGELKYVLYYDDYPVTPYGSIWNDTASEKSKVYVVQTSVEVIKRCILMTTNPSDLVLDITCGSGTTAYASEQWGRRWITCDSSRVALTLAKQRLLTSLFDYYELAYPQEGISSGLRYEIVPHITMGSLANNEPSSNEILYDQPLIDKQKLRVTGPFTVEAVPAPVVKSIDDIASDNLPLTGGDTEGVTATGDIARSGETLRYAEWKDELYRTGIRAKGGKTMKFSSVEILPASRWLHAEGISDNERVVISFGPEHAPLDQRQVSLAIEEAQTLVPKPKIIVFAAFQFDPEASKDIDETNWPGVTLLKAQMNGDLLTDDLKKKRSSNESFWLIGQPDVRISKISKGDDAGKYKVEVHGFDYYNPVTGNIESGGTDRIAMWMLDTDYDGRSLYPHQVFFPMSGEKDGWSRLAKNLKAEIDEDLIEAYRGTVSLPFEPGKYKRAAVKIVDDRGIESLKIVEIG